MDFSKKRLMSLIHQKSTLIPFLMELQMCKNLVRYCVPIFHKLCVFMVGNMCCYFFSDLSRLGIIKVRNCFHFLFYCVKTLTFPLQLVLKAFRLYNIFGSGANNVIHAQFMAQASISTMAKTSDCYVEPVHILQPGFMQCICCFG